jgi:hypothetical protein
MRPSSGTSTFSSSVAPLRYRTASRVHVLPHRAHACNCATWRRPPAVRSLGLICWASRKALRRRPRHFGCWRMPFPHERGCTGGQPPLRFPKLASSKSMRIREQCEGGGAGGNVLGPGRAESSPLLQQASRPRRAECSQCGEHRYVAACATFARAARQRRQGQRHVPAVLLARLWQNRRAQTPASAGFSTLATARVRRKQGARGERTSCD